MADVEHNTLTDPELHETKGAAAASAAEVLTADGAGAATFEAIPSPARFLTVAQSGADYTSVKTAVTAAAALSPTITDPVVVIVYPGTYTEDPISVPGYVSIVGSDGHDSAIISASTATSPLITLADGSAIKSITLMGASGAGGVGIEVTTGAECEVHCIVVHDCLTGMSADGASTLVRGLELHIIRRSAEVLTTGISITGGASATISDATISGISGTLITAGVVATGSGIVTVSAMTSEYCTTAIDSSASGTVEIAGSWIRNCTLAMDCGASGSISCMSVMVEDCTNDVAVTDGTSEFRFSGGYLTHEKIDIGTASPVMAYISETAGDESFNITAELRVGTEEQPKESSFGGGDSHVRGMSVFTNTNGEAGTWADITSTVNVDDGSSAALFPGLTAENTIYVGGNQKFTGLKADVTKAIVVGSGAVVSEYWDGSAWTSFATMSADAVSPYGQYANANLARVAVDQIRFDCPAMSDWATKDLDGTTAYWARYRITTTITTIPEVDIFKLHTNRTEINSDGRIENFGTGQRADTQIPIGQYVASASETPGSTNVSYATTIEGVNTHNVFANNTTDGRVYAVEVTPGWDTSRVGTVIVPWKPASAGAGDVILQLEYVVLNSGDAVDGSAIASNTSVTVAVSGQLDELIETELEFRIPSAVPPGLLVLKVFRDATGSDTFGANIELVAEPKLFATFWR